MYVKILKPVIDFVISFILLVLFSPVIVLVILLFLFANKGKVFFIQKRHGKDEKIFKLIKFKTMNDKKDIEGNLLPDEQRLTMIGNIIRRSSLGELLQFINVLKGDMPLIGQRPLLIEYLPLNNEENLHKYTL